jgi:hypothetical protein
LESESIVAVRFINDTEILTICKPEEATKFINHVCARYQNQCDQNDFEMIPLEKIDWNQVPESKAIVLGRYGIDNLEEIKDASYSTKLNSVAERVGSSSKLTS